VCAVFAFTGCKEETNGGGTGTWTWTGVTDPTADNTAPPIDIDFTLLSPAMKTAKLDVVIESVEDYVGYTMKIRGEYDPFFWEVTGETHHFILIDCPTGCPKYLEFVMNEKRVYPDDFPLLGTMIEFVGSFGVYHVDEVDFPIPFFAIDDFDIIS
jgi:hypothetical protein